MNKKLVEILVLSLGVNVVLALVIADQSNVLKKHRTYYRRSRSWATIMREAVTLHYERGGTLDLPEDMEAKMDAYMIFRDNNLD